MKVMHYVVALLLVWSCGQQNPPAQASVPADIEQVLQAIGYPRTESSLYGASLNLAEYILRMEAKRDRLTFDGKRFEGELALNEVVRSRRWGALDSEATLLALDREARVFMTEQMREMVAADPALNDSEPELTFNAILFRNGYVATIPEILEMASNPNPNRYSDLLAEAVCETNQ